MRNAAERMPYPTDNIGKNAGRLEPAARHKRTGRVRPLGEIMGSGLLLALIQVIA